MRIVAGFSQKSGHYHLPRATVLPPRSLTTQIWPWIDEELTKYRSVDTSLDSDIILDASARQFLELMEWLRIVFLQDAAILQASSPGSPLWRHAVFSLPDWEIFAGDVVKAHSVVDMPKDMLLSVMLPRVADVIEESSSNIMKTMNQHGDQLSREHDIASQQMNDLFRQVLTKIHRPRISIDLEDIPTAQLASLRQQFDTSVVPNSIPLSSSLLPSAAIHSIDASSSTRLHIARTPEGYPIEPFDKEWMTVDTAWREWHEGLSTGAGELKRDSIVSLEHKFGSKWRYNSSIKMWHSRRKKLIGYIDRRITQGEDREAVVTELQALGSSIDSIRKQLERRGLV
jgi:hypothetical protein